MTPKSRYSPVNNKKYSIAQITALLKTRIQQLMLADHISNAATQRYLSGKVTAGLLDEGRPEPFIQITQGSNATDDDLDRLNAVLRQSGLTNIVLNRTENTSMTTNAAPTGASDVVPAAQDSIIIFQETDSRARK